MNAPMVEGVAARMRDTEAGLVAIEAMLCDCGELPVLCEGKKVAAAVIVEENGLGPFVEWAKEW